MLPLTGRSRAWTGNPRVCEPEVCPGRAAPNRLMNEFYLSRSTTASLCLLSVAASLSPKSTLCTSCTFGMLDVGNLL